RDEQSDEHTEMDSDGNNESVANGTHSSANSDSNSKKLKVLCQGQHNKSI
ncbi:unnamed protein product, partial [Rotaria socialis]